MSIAEQCRRSLWNLSAFGDAIYRPDGSVIAGNAAMRRISSLTDAESDAVVANYNILGKGGRAASPGGSFAAARHAGVPEIAKHMKPCAPTRVEQIP